MSTWEGPLTSVCLGAQESLEQPFIGGHHAKSFKSLETTALLFQGLKYSVKACKSLSILQLLMWTSSAKQLTFAIDCSKETGLTVKIMSDKQVLLTIAQLH